MQPIRRTPNVQATGRNGGAFSDFAKYLAGLLPSERDACRFADYLVEFSDGDDDQGSDQQKALVQNLLAQAADLYSIGGMADQATAVSERLPI